MTDSKIKRKARRNRFCIFAGSNPGANPAYSSAAVALVQQIALREGSIVFGGGKVGLMGILADEAVRLGAKVTGVIPEGLVVREVAHSGIDEQIVVSTMHERKAVMASRSDAFIALPGGLGTLEELFEALTWAQLGIHDKPCCLLNVDGYYDDLLSFLNHSNKEGFIHSKHSALLIVESSPATLLDRIDSFAPPDVHAWMDSLEM